MHVKNKKVIKNLSTKSIYASKQRNLVLIFAIVLTTILFASVFTIGGGILKTMERSTCRQVGTTSHAGFKYLSFKEYDAIIRNPSIKTYSSSIVMSLAENKELAKVNTELRYAEEDYAKWAFSYPETGRMPKEYKEVAVSTLVLDALKLPHELGQEITFEFNARGKSYQETFTLCGFWKGDAIAQSQMAWLSKEYVQEIVPMKEQSYYEGLDDDVTGYISLDVYFSNSWNIEEKVLNVLQEEGFDPRVMRVGVNWAYGSSEVDLSTILLLGLVLLLIVFAGYLIIYNIFYISVVNDIQFYGLLKTIGTTYKQIGHLVRRQALMLSIIGIPFGLLFGWLLGNQLLPVILSTSYYKGEGVTSVNPLIMVGAICFTILTILISCRKPAKIAGKVSPVEALRYNEEPHGKKISKNHRKVSPTTMGLQNILRNKKKMISVLLSLLLSMVLLQTMYTVVSGFDLQRYVEGFVLSDFNVADDTLMNRYKLKYLDNTIVEQLQNDSDIKECSLVYMKEENTHIPSENALSKMKECLQQKKGTEQSFYENISWMLEQKRLPVHVYGIDERIHHQLSLVKGEINPDKFATGEYVYVEKNDTFSEGTGILFYDVGEKVPFTMEDGSTKEYTVLGVIDYPHQASCLFTNYPNFTFILPSSEYLEHYGLDTCIHVIYDVWPDKVNAMEEKLTKLSETTNIDFVSRKSIEAEFYETNHMIYIVGGALSAILGLIGILNFMNTIITSILTRKQELAMLQSVGMTTKQLRKMLVTEGMSYAVITLALACTIGNIFTWLVIKLLCGQLWYFTYHFTMLPILMCAPILLLISTIVPYIMFRTIQKRSIVERLRDV